MLDRTIYEDAEIFARNLHATGLHRRARLADLLRPLPLDHPHLDPPDLMIFLDCPVRTLRKRIAGRGRAMERDIPVSYLRRLDKHYRAWRARWDLSPVIELRTDRLDYITDLVDRLDLFRQIEQYL